MDFCSSKRVGTRVCAYVSADDGETSDDDSLSEPSDGDGCQYELIGVTVHTGTADGGHYYSFIRDRLNKNELGQDRWSVSKVNFGRVAPSILNLSSP